MVDCHIHMVLDGVFWKEAIRTHSEQPREDICRRRLQRYKSLGYTYLRDGGDRWGVGKLARKLASEYGITYRTPLAPLSMAGHYGGFIGAQYNSIKEYAELVVKQRQEGADFVKIMISGLMDFDCFGVLTEEGLEPGIIRQLIHVAHEEGMAVMAHANGARTVEVAAEAGVDSVEHGAYLDEAALQAMVQAGTVWVPTLSTVGNLLGKERYSREAVERILESSLLNLERFGAMGGLAAPGTDAGAWAVPHGIDTEKKLLAKAGITDTAEAEAVIMKKF